MSTNHHVTLIDLSSIAYPIWHMSQSDPDPNATSNQTVARVHALAAGSPYVAVCCDSGKTFRHDVDPTYKANRPEKEEARTHQIRLAQDRLKADGIPVWSAAGFEADDLIASASRQAVAAGHDVVVCTADKDLLALVSEHVHIKSTASGDVLDEAAVVTKLGVRPEQVTDYLCLVGDTSDNIKGAKGIGPKTAVKLLTQFGTLDDLYALIDAGPAATALTPAVLASLAELRTRLDVVRQLVRLSFDAPVGVSDVFRERPVPEMETAPVREPVVDVEPDHEPMPDPSAASMPESSAPLPAIAAPVKRNCNGHSNGHVVDTQTGELVLWERALEPRNMDDASRLSKIVHDSRQFLGAYGTPQAVMTTIMAGRELGLTAMASLRSIHVVEGKPTLSADLIRALVLRSGLAEYLRCTERTPERCTFETRRVGDPSPMTLTFTLDEAKQAGLVKPKSGWEKYPAAMLTARAGAALARLVYPDLTAGLYTPEELERVS